MFDVEALKYPGGHVSHLGSEVAEPIVLVYVPGGHFVCAVHLSDCLTLLEIVTIPLYPLFVRPSPPNAQTFEEEKSLPPLPSSGISSAQSEAS